MSDSIFIATRKGMFEVRRGGRWEVARSHFVGDAITYVLPPNAGAPGFAAFKHGHFGPKLHRTTDGGETWAECGTPKYAESEEASVEQLWSMAAAGDTL